MTAPAVFLPGVIAPAGVRYGPLFAQLAGYDLHAKDLEVYAQSSPPAGYSVATEVSGLDRFADEAGLERFHLYAHSGGGAVALAYVAEHRDRLISLALDEPATDFSEEDRRELESAELSDIMSLPPSERTRAFLRTNLAPGVDLPPPPSGEPPPWMALRPAGMAALAQAIGRHRIPEGAFERFGGPVYFSHGSLSAIRWTAMAERLGRHFRDYRSELYEGLHHLNTSHQAEPARVASRLRSLWARAEASP